MTRQLIVCDVETTGLDVEKHSVLEVAAVNVDTGEELYFVPALPVGALDEADGTALKLNGYFTRDVYAHRLNMDAADKYWRQLWSWLKGNTLGGSNPTFDAAMLNRAAQWGTQKTVIAGTVKFEQLPLSPWHHRLADLSAYAAGALRFAPTDLPGLDAVCRALGVVNEAEHSALGDARATAACFRKLADKHAEAAARTVALP